MGKEKPLMPLGASTVIERVVRTVVLAKVDDIVVVTGHQPERLTAVLDRLPVRSVHNPRYDAGMFSSIRAGVAALRADVDAFFVLPADYPLVRPEVLARLISAYRADEPAAAGVSSRIFHPTCCGRRGHPPLVGGRFRSELLRADDACDLRTFFRERADYEAEVEVEDLSILMDMDTEQDYRRICRLAGLLDRETAGGSGDPVTVRPHTASQAALSPVLAPEDAAYLLSLLDVPDRVVRHSRAVAQVGEALARALGSRGSAVDVETVRIAGLLHDIARASMTPIKHAAAGRNLLYNLGLSRVSEIVGVHMALPSEHVDSPLLTEEQLVYLADKLVAEDKVVGLEERAARTLRSLDGGAAPPGALGGLERRMAAAQKILDRIEASTGRPLLDHLREVLPREMFETHSSI